LVKKSSKKAEVDNDDEKIKRIQAELNMLLEKKAEKTEKAKTTSRVNANTQDSGSPIDSTNDVSENTKKLNDLNNACPAETPKKKQKASKNVNHDDANKSASSKTKNMQQTCTTTSSTNELIKIALFLVNKVI